MTDVTNIFNDRTIKATISGMVEDLRERYASKLIGVEDQAITTAILDQIPDSKYTVKSLSKILKNMSDERIMESLTTCAGLSTEEEEEAKEFMDLAEASIKDKVGENKAAAFYVNVLKALRARIIPLDLEAVFKYIDGARTIEEPKINGHQDLEPIAPVMIGGQRILDNCVNKITSESPSLRGEQRRDNPQLV